MPNYKTVLFSLLLVLSLINNNFFGNNASFAFFSFSIIASVLCFSISIERTFSKTISRLPVQILLPSIIFILLCSYFFFRSFLDSNLVINRTHYHVFTISILMLILTTEFYKYKSLFNVFCRIIIVVAFIESIICILQYAGVLSSMSIYFKCTGTWSNPNVTGTFLALSMPILALVYIDKKIPYSKAVVATLFTVSFIAILMLRSRSAFVGVIVISISVVFLKYEIFSHLKNRLSKIALLLIIFITIIASLSLGYGLYKYKEASSQGRLFVWKTSLKTIAKNPVFGIGLGMFEHGYNLAQADYFKEGTANETEIKNAAFIQIPYNELLSISIEGGIIGLVIFCMFLFSILVKFASIFVYKKDNSLENIIAISGIIAFLVISLLNYTICAVPVMLLFIIYVAKISATFNGQSTIFPAVSKVLSKFSNQKQSSEKSFFLMVSCFTVMILLYEITQARASALVQQIIISKKGTDKSQPLIAFTSLAEPLANYPEFNDRYARLLCQAQEHKKAIEIYKKALLFSSNPDYYTSLATCYYHVGMYEEAIQAYTIAKNIQPNRFRTRLALMRMYVLKKDMTTALSYAHEIVMMEPKIPSKTVALCKLRANELIEKYDTKTIFDFNE